MRYVLRRLGFFALTLWVALTCGGPARAEGPYRTCRLAGSPRWPAASTPG